MTLLLITNSSAVLSASSLLSLMSAVLGLTCLTLLPPGLASPHLTRLTVTLSFQDPSQGWLATPPRPKNK